MAQAGFESLLAGHRLAGRYHVEEVIGRGGFAAVYRATDERLGRTVAVKVITHSAGAPELRDEIQKRFQREARAIASLHHPNVVTVYDFGTDEALGLDFLVMELLEGRCSPSGCGAPSRWRWTRRSASWPTRRRGWRRGTARDWCTAT